jgi:DNA-binding transcriptional regulator YbjK
MAGGTPRSRPAQPKRRAAGQRRRQAIVDAAVQLLGTQGRAAVTHRRVAELAGVPLSATTYYFASLDELVVEALRATARSDVQAVEDLGAELRDGTPDAVAARVAHAIAERCGPEQRVRSLAIYELHLDAARRPLLRADVQAWLAAIADIAEELVAAGAPDGPARRNALVAALDGVLLHALVADPPPSAHELAPVVEAIIRGTMGQQGP